LKFQAKPEKPQTVPGEGGYFFAAPGRPASESEISKILLAAPKQSDSDVVLQSLIFTRSQSVSQLRSVQFILKLSKHILF